MGIFVLLLLGFWKANPRFVLFGFQPTFSWLFFATISRAGVDARLVHGWWVGGKSFGFGSKITKFIGHFDPMLLVYWIAVVFVLVQNPTKTKSLGFGWAEVSHLDFSKTHFWKTRQSQVTGVGFRFF